ncbi:MULTISPECIES: GtrA family protein [unclassified Salinibacterium]|uniref:GtrA family protein n=1 Tax=unclassified Salinibacterium TaxID=2632331 RepID=UPI0014215857|nr:MULTISPECIES: GtrA family protein [unclassified Salinibacterium]
MALPTPASLAGLSGQGLKYLVVASLTSLFYLGVMSLGLLIGWHYFIAIVIAQAVTIAGAFPAYRRFVFQSTGPIGRDFVRFLSVWLTGMIAGLVLTPLMVELVGMHPLVAQVIAIAVVSIGSFLAHRYFSFKPSTDVADSRALPGDGNL